MVKKKVKTVRPYATTSIIKPVTEEPIEPEQPPKENSSVEPDTSIKSQRHSSQSQSVQKEDQKPVKSVPVVQLSQTAANVRKWTSIRKQGVPINSTVTKDNPSLPKMVIPLSIENEILQLRNIRMRRLEGMKYVKPTLFQLWNVWRELSDMDVEKLHIKEALKNTRDWSLFGAITQIGLDVPADECPEGFTDVVYYDPSLTPKISILSTSRPSTPTKKYVSEDDDASDGDATVSERRSPDPVPEKYLPLTDQEPPVFFKPESNLKDWILNHPVDSEQEELPGDYNPLNGKGKPKKKKKESRDTTRPSDEIIAARRKIKELIKQEKEVSRNDEIDLTVEAGPVSHGHLEAGIQSVIIAPAAEDEINTAPGEPHQPTTPVKQMTPTLSRIGRDSESPQETVIQHKRESYAPREASPDSGLSEIDVFNASNPNFANPPATIPVITPQADYIELSFPKSWLGNTPVKLLRTTCKAKNYGNFRFFTLPKGPCYGYRLGVDIDSKGQFMMREGELCRARRDAEEYVALKALFEIYLRDPVKTQTYTTLPESCKLLWRDWQIDAETANQMEHIAKEEEYARDLDEVFARASRHNHSPLTKDNIVKTSEIENGTAVGRTLSARGAHTWMARIESARYHDMYQARQQLPMFTHRAKVINALRQSRVVILSGETGCGKSTQLPQFILEEWAGNAYIVCAQPRRISAISLASRVSTELADTAPLGAAGTIVGYAVRFDTKVSSDTRILYCTLGVATRMLENTHESERWTHLVIDEVHERNLDSDFLIAVVKDMLQRNPNLRIVLMSATLTASLYLSYFENLDPVHVHVPGRTFPVENKFLENIMTETRYFDEKSLETVSNQTVRMKIAGTNGKSTVDVPVASNGSTIREDTKEVNHDLLEHLIKYILYSENYPAEGSILVFFPGVSDIDNLANRLAARKGWYAGVIEDIVREGNIDDQVITIDDSGTLIRSGKVWITTCHSKLTNAEQARVFETPPTGIRKIVLSTNIAETGVTIPDVTHVIDTGLAKNLKYSAHTSLTTLAASYISKANAKQRSGRAGRVRAGYSWRCFSAEKYEKMESEFKAEILRLPLEEVILRAKVLGLCKNETSGIETWLSQMMTPPPNNNVLRAVGNLIEAQAISASDQSLTILGRHMANLPLPLALARLLLFSSLEPATLATAITIAALLSNTKPLLARGLAPKQVIAANGDLRKWFSIDFDWKSDLLLQVAIWNEYHYGRQGKATWSAHINHETLKTTRRSIQQIVETMKSSRLLADHYRYNTAQPTRKEIFPLIISTLFAGLYPKIAYQSYSGLSTMPSLQKLPGLPREEAIHLRIHRNSAYTAASFTQGQFIVYHDIMGKEWMHGDTKKIAGDLSDVNLVLSTPIFIYGGALEYDASLKIMTVGARVRFKCFPRTAALLRVLRDELDAIFDKAFDNPNWIPDEDSTKVMECYYKLLQAELSWSD